jgi:hypothetical protein
VIDCTIRRRFPRSGGGVVPERSSAIEKRCLESGGGEGAVDRGKIILVRPICTTNGRISALIRINPPLQNGSRGD